MCFTVERHEHCVLSSNGLCAVQVSLSVHIYAGELLWGNSGPASARASMSPSNSTAAASSEAQGQQTQQPASIITAQAAAAQAAPAKGRNRRSSSFDLVAAKQGGAHRKTSSFDTALLGLQQSKPDAILGNRSRGGAGMLGSGMAGMGAGEVQVPHGSLSAHIHLSTVLDQPMSWSSAFMDIRIFAVLLQHTASDLHVRSLPPQACLLDSAIACACAGY